MAGLHPVGVVEITPCVVFPIPGSSALHAAFRPVSAALLLAYVPLTPAPLVQQA